ncbi:MAG: FecR domain-containing protein, partial [Candidatus Hydrogenedentes bacterium]|nr:FecR domain-containing protein [Candidatus Hydrogenedentota bacterium]
ATAILGVALVILMAVWPHEPLGVVAKVTNSAQLLRSDANTTGPSTISIGDAVLPGDTVLVGNGSRLIVALKTAELKLNSGSMLRLTGGREVELVKGELYADVDKANQPFRIKLSSGTITVLGTKFLVQALEDKTVVTVARGNVLFKNPTGYSEVRAGTQSVSFAGGIPTEPQEIEVPEVTRWADEFVVTKEDKALARMRGASLPEERYRDVPLSRGEPIQTKSWLFDTRSRGSDRSEIRYISINRNAFGTDPRLPVDNNFAIYICDPAMKPLGRAEGSYSLFDGTDSVAVLRLTNPVSVQGMFLVIFQPFAGSDLATGKSQRTLYSGLQGISPKIVIEPLENMPAMEGINVS